MIHLKKNRDERHDIESQEGEKDNVHYDLPLIEKKFIHHLVALRYHNPATLNRIKNSDS